jgi:hypothetical protein
VSCCSPTQISFCERASRQFLYFVARLPAPALSLAAGDWLVLASITDLHASLSSALFSPRQAVIASALGMNALHNLSTSGVHASCCSSVPCAKLGVGEAAADSMAANIHDRAKGIDRNSIALFLLSMFIAGSVAHGRGPLDLVITDVDTPLPERGLVAKRRSL